MADRDGHVTSRVGDSILFENPVVRVWIMQLAPGEASEFHRHEYDYIFMYSTPSRIALIRPGVSPVEEVFEAGYVQYVNVGDGTEHQIINTGDQVHMQFIVELKAVGLRPPNSDNGRRRLSGAP